MEKAWLCFHLISSSHYKYLDALTWMNLESFCIQLKLKINFLMEINGFIIMLKNWLKYLSGHVFNLTFSSKFNENKIVVLLSTEMS